MFNGMMNVEGLSGNRALSASLLDYT